VFHKINKKNLPQKKPPINNNQHKIFLKKKAKSINIENNIKVKTKRPTKLQNKLESFSKKNSFL
jgi:hypothetical protein